MILQPCYRCAFRNGCELKAGILKRARGLGLATGRVRCPIRLAGMPNGKRVRVKIFNAIQVSDDGDYESREYDGILLRPTGNKLLVWLDEPLESGRVRVHVHHDNVKPIAGFDPICTACGNPESKGRADWESEALAEVSA